MLFTAASQGGVRGVEGDETREDVIFLIPGEPCAQKYARMVAISRAPGKKENVERSPPGSSC